MESQKENENKRPLVSLAKFVLDLETTVSTTHEINSNDKIF